MQKGRIALDDAPLANGIAACGSACRPVPACRLIYRLAPVGRAALDDVVRLAAEGQGGLALAPPVLVLEDEPDDVRIALGGHVGEGRGGRDDLLRVGAHLLGRGGDLLGGGRALLGHRGDGADAPGERVRGRSHGGGALRRLRSRRHGLDRSGAARRCTWNGERVDRPEVEHPVHADKHDERDQDRGRAEELRPNIEAHGRQPSIRQDPDGRGGDDPTGDGPSDASQEVWTGAVAVGIGKHPEDAGSGGPRSWVPVGD
jgi:hypothetical protein